MRACAGPPRPSECKNDMAGELEGSVSMSMVSYGVADPPTASARGAGERVLIVEDDSAARVGLEQLVKSWGFVAESAMDGEDALEKVTSFRPAIVISDLVMPRLDGLGLLRALQAQGADVTTLLLTAQGTVETAVEAMKEGAYDYLTKPIDLQRLKILLDKIVERLETLREVKALRRQLREHGTFGSMIGNSPEMRKIYQVIEQSAPTGASVLVTGESGTGKELVAQTIHQLSPRASFPFVAINCAAIPETLLESEIFGHEKGAFTGAADRRQGCFELADRGTLFPDEIGEMTPATQVKQRSIAGLEHEAIGMLEKYGWPGNVRELRNVMERATILAPGPFIEVKHLPPVLTQEPPAQHSEQLAISPGTAVEEAERRLIVMTLAHTRDNKTRAAEILGISLKTLHNKLNKLRLRPKKTD